jgi:hypothetical protein
VTLTYVVDCSLAIDALAGRKKITDHRGEQMLADYARLRINDGLVTSSEQPLPPPLHADSVQPLQSPTRG